MRRRERVPRTQRWLRLIAGVSASLAVLLGSHVEVSADGMEPEDDDLATDTRPVAPTPVPLPLCLHEDQAIYYGPEGLIVHNGDQNHNGILDEGEAEYGDTAQREGWYWLGLWLRQHKVNAPWDETPPRQLSFDQVLALLEPSGDGVFRRAPQYDPYSDYGLTRDQLIPLVAAMGVWGRKEALQRLWNALPEDLAGKHAFGPNGRWLNVFGQPMSHCDEIEARGCNAEGDCSLREDTRPCQVELDTTPCPLQEDTRDCSRAGNCGHDGCPCEVRGCPGDCPPSCADQCFCPQGCGPEWWKCAYERVCAPDLDCQARKLDCERLKAPEEAACAVLKAACEAGKAAQNSIYVGAKAECETKKALKNLPRQAEKASCELSKGTQNALYKAEHDACEAKKTINKFLCEGDKAAATALCRATRFRFTGDLIGPSTINTFVQAGVAPISTNPVVLAELAGVPHLGDVEVGVNVGIRRQKGQDDRDDTGDDLNLIVQLLMSRLFMPTPVNQTAVESYLGRAHSFGSYFQAYCAAHGPAVAADMHNGNVRRGMEAGIARGWAPDVPGPYGVLRWYHRWDSGANPRLAALYDPILSGLLK